MNILPCRTRVLEPQEVTVCDLQLDAHVVTYMSAGGSTFFERAFCQLNALLQTPAQRVGLCVDAIPRIKERAQGVFFR